MALWNTVIAGLCRASGRPAMLCWRRKVTTNPTARGSNVPYCHALLETLTCPTATLSSRL